MVKLTLIFALMVLSGCQISGGRTYKIKLVGKNLDKQIQENGGIIIFIRRTRIVDGSWGSNQAWVQSISAPTLQFKTPLRIDGFFSVTEYLAYILLPSYRIEYISFEHPSFDVNHEEPHGHWKISPVATDSPDPFIDVFEWLGESRGYVGGISNVARVLIEKMHQGKLQRELYPIAVKLLRQYDQELDAIRPKDRWGRIRVERSKKQIKKSIESLAPRAEVIVKHDRNNRELKHDETPDPMN